jgi:hypothetical protein
MKQQHTATATSILTTKSTYRSLSAQRLSEVKMSVIILPNIRKSGWRHAVQDSCLICSADVISVWVIFMENGSDTCVCLSVRWQRVKYCKWFRLFWYGKLPWICLVSKSWSSHLLQKEQPAVSVGLCTYVTSTFILPNDLHEICCEY